MKARPRRAEREVARHLSSFFEALGLPAVERIPVLGRTGPDITWNEFKLIVDVKSRLSVPKGISIPKGKVYRGGLNWFGVRLEEIPLLAKINAAEIICMTTSRALTAGSPTCTPGQGLRCLTA